MTLNSEDKPEAKFDVNIKSQRKYTPLDADLSLKIRQIAEERGISEHKIKT
ncbi:hypothetical protein GWO43_10500 [candidate division KSB1 bacterium]|nr:hypothetical protein [candidate division KSB1 bacterium]NIR69822.1 hypothetical protein [candidate division KSB1 bacterium]NIS24369.1 hypothetical protein [candidate division KSB1 bacterium]NIT71305.1 hypothetical protein [candidate division KSB1 bacterium]NIU27600.1 hypothetical protein [candidate division KSB1 bacterium]